MDEESRRAFERNEWLATGLLVVVVVAVMALGMVLRFGLP